jgi:hypothetical protein
MYTKFKIHWLVISMIYVIIFIVLTTFGNTFKIADSQNSKFLTTNSLLENNEMNNQGQIVSDILPPDIVFNYNNTNYNGKLINYKYREGYSFNESDLTIKNLTNHFSNQNPILINNGSQIKFIVKEYPERIEPLRLFVTAYQIDGNTVKVLRNLDNVNNQENTYQVNLSKGNYLFIATTTSIPETSKNVGGFVIYAYSLTIK